MKIFRYALITAIVFMPFIAFAAEYEIKKFNESQWFIYDGNLKTALVVNSTSEPQCYQIGEILIFLNDRKQALDNELLQNAARNGLANYQAYCAKKKQQGSKTKNFVAFVNQENILVSGRITSAGSPQDGVLEIRSNKVAIVQKNTSSGAKIQNKFNEERKLKLETERIEVEAIRSRFSLQYEQSRDSMTKIGFLDGIFGGESAKLTGAWSSSETQCKHDILLLNENDGFGIVEWWREFRNYGLLPWRSGSWNLKSEIITMTFNHRTESTFIKGFEDTIMNETIQFVLKSISSDELYLSSPGPSSQALKLLKVDEKLFIRCPIIEQ